MALISEWMQQCGKKVLDNAGIVREACYEQLPLSFELKPLAKRERTNKEYDLAGRCLELRGARIGCAPLIGLLRFLLTYDCPIRHDAAL